MGHPVYVYVSVMKVLTRNKSILVIINMKSHTIYIVVVLQQHLWHGLAYKKHDMLLNQVNKLILYISEQ